MFTFIRQIIEQCWRLVRFEIGPQDFPYAKQWLLTLLGINALLVVAVNQLVQAPIQNIFLVVKLCSYVWWLLFVALMLLVVHHMPRFRQTITAYFGAEMIFNTLIFLVLLVLVVSNSSMLAGMLAIALYIWSFIVYSHILRHALSITFGRALLVLILFEITRQFIIYQFIKVT